MWDTACEYVTGTGCAGRVLGCADRAGGGGAGSFSLSSHEGRRPREYGGGLTLPSRGGTAHKHRGILDGFNR